MRNAVFTTAIFLGIGTLASLGCSSNSPAAPNNGNAGAGGADQDAAAADGATADVDPGLEAGNAAKPYPAGPYGYAPGSTIQNYKFLGWKDPSAVNYTGDLEPIELADYYDPDGTKGIHALFINASARWCVVCQGEQGDIKTQVVNYGPKGVAFLETLFEDANQYPAQPTDLAYWTKKYSIIWPTVLDPNNKLSPFFDTTATPMNMIVDTKTMTVKALITGAPQNQAWWDTNLQPLLK